jgi:hypothetical protein
MEIFNMSDQSLIEKRKTSENSKNSILTARVIANYGDPGLDEDYQFDILSRFVIVAIESSDRIPTSDKWWHGMIAVVLRPRPLWIDLVGAQTANPSDQQRMDQIGNTNTGLSTNYAINTITRINEPYQVGELISIKKLGKPLLLNNQNQSEIFQSAFATMPTTPTDQTKYNSWYNYGAFLAYILSNNAQNELRSKTIALASNTGPNTFYYPILNKYQYEVFSLLQNTNNVAITSALTQIFNGSWKGDSQVYRAHGGYIFQSVNSIDIPVIEYEDINAGNKQRISSNACIPLIVTTPNSFPAPKVRSTGTINYNPTVVIVSP